MKKNIEVKIIPLEWSGLEYDLDHVSTVESRKRKIKHRDQFKKSIRSSKSLNAMIGRTNFKKFVNKHLHQGPFFNETEQDEIQVKSILNIEQLLEHVRAGLFPSTRVHFYTKDGDPLPMNDYQIRRFNSALHLEDGGSLSVRELQWAIPSIRKIAADLQYSFGCNVNVNAYLTPPKTQTFSLHWDDHDTLALQLEGTKVWTAYEPIANSPIRSHIFDRSISDKNFKKIDNYKLVDGSFLYLPRGHIHKAVAQKDYSLHITFGLYPVIPANFLKSLFPTIIEKFMANEKFGYDLSTRTLQTSKDISDEIKARLTEIIKEINFDESLHRFTSEYWENLQPQTYELKLNQILTYSGLPYKGINQAGIFGIKTTRFAVMVEKNLLPTLDHLLKRLVEDNIHFVTSLTSKEIEILKALNSAGIIRARDNSDEN